MSMLNLAIKIASDAHKDQYDKAGQPYILHLLRVMMQLESDEERIVGVLHDTLEDSELTISDLLKVGFTDDIIEALKSVTRHGNESYFDFILRAKQNEIGRKVKLADLRDNMDWGRIEQPTEEDMKRMQKYQKAYFMLAESREAE